VDQDKDSLQRLQLGIASSCWPCLRPEGLATLLIVNPQTSTRLTKHSTKTNFTISHLDVNGKIKWIVMLQLWDQDELFSSKDAGIHRLLLLALLEAQTLGSLGSDSSSDRPLPAKAKARALSPPLGCGVT
jgi:hypothetical protein